MAYRYVDERPVVTLTFNAPGLESPVVVRARSVVQVVEAGLALSRDQALALAAAWRIQVGKGQSLKTLRHAVTGRMQMAWYKATGKEIGEAMAERQKKREEAVSGEVTQEQTEKKERQRKRFVFQEPKKEESVKTLAKKRGQAKIVLDILRAAEEGTVWTVESLSEALVAHPEFKTTSKPEKIANYYVWEYRMLGAVKMVA